METSPKCDLDIISSLIRSKFSFQLLGGKYSLILSARKKNIVNLGKIGYLKNISFCFLFSGPSSPVLHRDRVDGLGEGEFAREREREGGREGVVEGEGGLPHLRHLEVLVDACHGRRHDAIGVLAVGSP